MAEHEENDAPLFAEQDRLELLQLRTRKNLEEERESGKEHQDTRSARELGQMPEAWRLTGDYDLYDWQSECIDAWFSAGEKGTVKVVTGAGKTVMALGLAERLQNEKEPGLCMAVVVPQINLMNQWYDELLEVGNIPPQYIGRLAGEYDGNLEGDTRILLGVVNTMRDELPGMVRDAGIEDDLLLVADECHHYGSEANSKIFQAERAYSLGLSATPERSDMDEGYDNSLLGRELGDIVYELTLEDALERGLVPPYRINHYGLALTPEEERKYEQLSRAISDLRSELKGQAPPGRTSGNAFFRWVEEVANGDGELANSAQRFGALTSQRKELLYGLQGRRDAVLELIDEAFEEKSDARIILFHERIREVNRLYVELERKGYPVALEHSKLPDSIRRESIELFREGTAQIIVSAKSLIEGFDVPECDIGIIVASSQSDRQRVQSLGRMLRKSTGEDGEQKRSSIHVLYGKGTTDERLYEQTDWERLTGVEQNEYFEWESGEDPEPKEGPPKRPLPSEGDVNISELETGDVYPGEYQGMELTCDSQKNVRNEEGDFWPNSQEVVGKVREVKGSFGRFRVTPQRHLVLVRVREGEEWETRFVMQLDEAPSFQSEANASKGNPDVDIDEWVAEAEPGDAYPLSYETDDDALQSLGFTRKRGGRLQRPRPEGNGTEWTKMPGEAESEEQGQNAARAVNSLKRLHSQGEQISKVLLNEHDHLLYRRAGKLHFVCDISGGLEFPSDD